MNISGVTNYSKNKLQNIQVKDKQDLVQNLREKYSCVRNGYCKVSSSYIKKCEDDPQKMMELIRKISFFEQNQKDEVQWANANGIRLNSSSVEIDADGNACNYCLDTTRSSDRGYVNSYNTETGSRNATSYLLDGKDKSDSLSDQIIRGNKNHLKSLDSIREKARIEQRRIELREEQERMQQIFFRS